MGGTSFDLCLVRGGRPEIKTDWNWRYRYYIGLPMVDVQSVGAGGGSIARVRQGALLVGPGVGRLGARARSATAAAATAPTVTDADAVLGYLPVDGLRRRAHELDVDGAPRRDRRATSPSRSASTWSRRRGASSASSTPTWPTRPGGCSPAHGADPRDLALIAYGGNGAVHAWAIAAELGIDRIARAQGGARVLARSACSWPTTSSTSCARTSSRSRRSTSAALRDLHARARPTRSRKELEPTGLAERRRRHATLFAQMCYPGQNFDMSVPVARGRGARRAPSSSTSPSASTTSTRPTAGSPSATSSRSCAACGSPRGAARRSPTALAEIGHASPTPARPARAAAPVYFGVEFVDTPVYDGTVLGAGRDGRRARR